ncbi:flagellar protein [Thiohalobacter sp. COW1]|uniref:Flagellar protein n=1 Tax=Thiohalobacter thiocyanaticus TaxID=585455 RepID=A0A1Z4VRQ1_9GAMM|nr:MULTISPECIES: flagellar biosynthetic protein FliO [Thiohalobacter]BAZ93884.1 flagellar biosynthesis protein FliO [Thiohalobacter thiocyanaticus]BCO31048.1 flagellar protein [Thiohalobacter sp. COW1]
MMSFPARITVTLALLWPLTLQASEGRQAAESLNDPMAWSNLLQVLLGLVAVIVLMLIFAWLMRRMSGFQGGVPGAMRVLGGLSMGAREKVVLIQVGETQLVLGVAPGRVQTLHVLEEKIETPVREGAGMNSFARNLQQALSRGDRS